jgi:predicted dehydrogenase
MFNGKKIRYAVVGLGHIAQIAVLPAFKHASEKCELTALISDDQDKIKEVSKQYSVSQHWSYAQYEEALASDVFDAVYIALPNDMHKKFAIQAANAGKHVLCEKPMAMNEGECVEMIEAAEANNIKLMIAYRLHFEKTNMTAVEIIQSRKIGEPRVFNSSFTLQVREGNIRTQKEHGGGPLMDIGIYCINAARYLFRDEPLRVTALAVRSNDPRFAEIEESLSAVMIFPGERIATFACSFGSKDISRYEVMGTKGHITLDPAYEYADELEYTIVIGDKEERHKTPKRDQFAPELLHFAECIIDDKEPRPDGYEGLNDLRVIDALRESVRTGTAIDIEPLTQGSLPDEKLIQEKPGVKKPALTKVQSGSK